MTGDPVFDKEPTCKTMGAKCGTQDDALRANEAEMVIEEEPEEPEYLGPRGCHLCVLPRRASSGGREHVPPLSRISRE